MKILISAIALFASTAIPAMANHDFRDAGINQRQQQIERRLQQGWRAGELTQLEYRRLQHVLREIDRAEHHYAADGHLSRRERDELHARLDHLSREVYRQKHDVERRSGFYNDGPRAERRY